MKKGTVKLRGLRSPLPKGTIIARPAPGKGDAELVKAGTALALRRDRLDTTISGDVIIDQTGQATVVGLQSIPVGTTAPALNDVLTFDGINWNPAVGGGGGSGITQLTGDVTAGPGTGSQPATLANSGVTAATYGDATHVPQIAIDGKGRVTSASNIAISGGGGGAMTAISTLTPTGNVASFTGISGSYRTLVLIGAGRSDSIGVPVEPVAMTFNTDTGANYTMQFVLSLGTGTAGAASDVGDNGIFPVRLPAAGGIAGYPGSFRIEIPLYARTTLKKSCFWKEQGFADATINDVRFSDGCGLWDNSSAISRIDLTLLFGGNWLNAEISLYGIS